MAKVLSREGDRFIDERADPSDIYLEWLTGSDVHRLPEHGLLCAVLSRAVRDICGSRDVYPLGERGLCELMEWVLTYQTDEVYGFRYCCEHLGYDVSFMGTWFVYWANERSVALPRRPWMFEVRELDEELCRFFERVAEALRRRRELGSVTLHD